MTRRSSSILLDDFGDTRPCLLGAQQGYKTYTLDQEWDTLEGHISSEGGRLTGALHMHGGFATGKQSGQSGTAELTRWARLLRVEEARSNTRFRV